MAALLAEGVGEVTTASLPGRLRRRSPARWHWTGGFYNTGTGRRAIGSGNPVLFGGSLHFVSKATDQVFEPFVF
jgi:hypothetical protein